MKNPDELPVRDDPTNPDIDPELLLESGRASAVATQNERIDSLAGDITSLLDESKSLKNVTLETVLAENGRFRRRNNVLIAMIFVLVLLNIYQQYRSTFVTGPKLDDIEKTVNGPLSKANEGIDKINAFIDQVKVTGAQNAAQQQLTRDQVTQLRDLICASTDSARLEACGETPLPK